jgi:hypothetical protein
MPDVAFGFGCPSCGFSIGVGIGGAGPCPECGTQMQSLPAGTQIPETVTGFECPHCEYSAGMLLGFNGTCPECHKPVS